MGSWDASTNSPVLGSGGGEAAAGTTTGVQANKLIDSTQSFTSTVTVGDQVINQVDGQSALVTNVDSNTTLSLDADIMLSGEDYTIDNSPFITQGHYYVVSVGGTTTLNGVSNWSVGDWVIAGANNQWTKLDHSQVDGTGTTGNLTKWSATQVIADSIVSESGSAITVDGSLLTNTNLSSTGDFAVNTDKFTVAASSGNTAFTGDLAINTNKFTVNATTGNTLVAGTLDVSGKTTFDDDIKISDTNPILDFEDTDNTGNNWRMEARGAFGGFFFQSFDNNFQTGSTILFTEYTNGYIGLGGNTNPQAQLDITGGLITSSDATFAGSVQVGSTAGYTTISQGAFFTKGGGDMFTANLLAGAAVSPMFKLQRNDVEKYNIGLDGNDNLAFINASGDAKMSIDSSGNLLMGLTSATTTDGTNIELASSTSSRYILASTGTGGHKWTMATGTDGALAFYDYTESAYRMRIDSSGLVTITRSFTPAASLSDITQLKIENTDTSFGGSAAGIQLDAGNGDTTGFILSRADGNDNTFEGVIIGTATDNPIIFSTNTGTTSITTNERMRIDSSGNVRFTGTAPNSGDEITQLNFYNTTSSINLARITGIRQAGGSSYGALTFSTTNSGTIAERMRT
jgi:hypothetical protein